MTTKEERFMVFGEFQAAIKRADTYDDGIKALLKFRGYVREMYDEIFDRCLAEDFSAMPLKTDDTIGFNLYHLQRIEDITSNTLVAGREQIFFARGYDKALNSPIITTANELPRDSLPEFSAKLDYEQLHKYIIEVHENTNRIIRETDFAASRLKISEERRNALIALNVVSTEDSAFWLVDYWCKKTVAGLMLMPFSRHQLMHIDGSMRIIESLEKKRKKKSR